MEVREVIDLETPMPGTSKRSAISVEKYCFKRDLRRAAMASSSALIVLDDEDDPDVQVLSFSRIEIGESSSSKPSRAKTPILLCEICDEEKTRREWFRIQGCGHAYCNACMASYVAAKLEDNVSAIACPSPGCRTGKLSLQDCRGILPPDVFERWGFAVCEASIRGSEKFVYCPYKDCSAMLINDENEPVAEASCPACGRAFCVQCGVAWHSGIGCAEFRSLGAGEREKEDLMLRRLAKSKQWKRCPKCSIYVERSEGCLYIKCRCGSAFCYNCGSVNEDHSTHHCKKCSRTY